MHASSPHVQSHTQREEVTSARSPAIADRALGFIARVSVHVCSAARAPMDGEGRLASMSRGDERWVAVVGGPVVERVAAARIVAAHVHLQCCA